MMIAGVRQVEAEVEGRETAPASLTVVDMQTPEFLLADPESNRITRS
jgi:hypothetical protein